jgi:hypothetical protein
VLTKRYQVFVSSTYDDLRKERQQIIRTLLELDCIPSGMELFPASDEVHPSLTRQVIDDCDYFIVLIGGRYGSVGREGKSYTQMEFEYAVATHKPILAFIHGSPGRLPAERLEQERDLRVKLDEFRKLVKEHGTCSLWHSAQELGTLVSASMTRLMKYKPAIGWIRANAAPQVKRWYRDNNHLFRAALSDYIESNGKNIKRAILIQYSGYNVLPLLQDLWRNTDAEIHLYVLSPEGKYALDNQRERIGKFEKELPRELSETNTEAVLHYWHYDVPASPRIITLNDDLIALGPFLYQARDHKSQETLDVWGGEVPIMLVRNTDPDFSLVWNMTDMLVRNWSAAALARELWSVNRAQRMLRASYGASARR